MVQIHILVFISDRSGFQVLCKVNFLKFIIFRKLHAAHTDCILLLLRNLVHRELDKVSLLRLQNDIDLVAQYGDFHNTVAFLQRGRLNGPLDDIEFAAGDDLHHRFLRDKQEAAKIDIALAYDQDDCLVLGRIVADIVDRNPLIPQFSKRQIGNLHRVHEPGVGEEADLCIIPDFYHISVFGKNRLLVAVKCRLINRFGVAKAVHHEIDIDRFLFLHDDDRRAGIDNVRLPLGGVILLVGKKIFLDDLLHRTALLQNVLVLENVRYGLFMFLRKLIDFQSDETVQAHIENGIRLCLGECKVLRHDARLAAAERDAGHLSGSETVLRLLPRLRPADDLDDEVNDVARLNQAFLDLTLFLLLAEEIRVFAAVDLELEPDTLFENALQVQRLRFSSPDGEHVDAEGVLKTRFRVEKILEILNIRAFPQLDDNADALLRRLVRDIDNVTGYMGFLQLGNIREKLSDPGTDHRIRDLRDSLPSLRSHGRGCGPFPCRFHRFHGDRPYSR